MVGGVTTQRLQRILQRSQFYWRRLRGERVTKSLGIGAVVFALVIQSFAVFQPQSAQAAVSDPNDNIIYQGAANKNALMAVYDRGVDSAGHADIKQIYSHFGITRQDLMNATEGTYSTNDFNGQIKTTGRLDWRVSNRQAVSVPGASTSIYTGGFLDGYNSKQYPMRALIGKRAIDGQWFAITLDCGNIVYVTLPPKPVKNISVCRPGTGVITIKETERQSGDVAQDSPACKPSTYACVSLRVTPITRTANGQVTRATFTTNTTATNATLTSVTYVVRDGSGREISRSTNSQYDQQLPGDYTVQAYATFDVKGESQTVTSAACKVSFVVPAENQITVCRPGTGVITIKQSEKRSTDLPADDAACQPKPVVPTTTTPTPTPTPAPVQLPKTGTGDVMLGALGLSLLSAATYFYLDSRRLLGAARL